MTVRFPDELLFHHCMPVQNVTFGTIQRPDRRFSHWHFRPAYDWLTERIGFFPFFFAVGCDEHAVRMTGYEDNWRVWMASTVVRGTRREIYRRRGEFPNLALFSFDEMDGIFMDYAYWDIALNACMGNRPVTAEEVQKMFKPSWTRARWIRAARSGTHSVQLVAPGLPLERSAHVSVRNRATQQRLAAMGFPEPVVLRIPVNRWG